MKTIIVIMILMTVTMMWEMNKDWNCLVYLSMFKLKYKVIFFTVICLRVYFTLCYYFSFTFSYTNSDANITHCLFYTYSTPCLETFKVAFSRNINQNLGCTYNNKNEKNLISSLSLVEKRKLLQIKFVQILVKKVNNILSQKIIFNAIKIQWNPKDVNFKVSTRSLVCCWNVYM